MVSLVCGFIPTAVTTSDLVRYVEGIGSVRKAQKLLNSVPKNQAIVGASSVDDVSGVIMLHSHFLLIDQMVIIWCLSTQQGNTHTLPSQKVSVVFQHRMYCAVERICSLLS